MRHCRSAVQILHSLSMCAVHFAAVFVIQVFIGMRKGTLKPSRALNTRKSPYHDSSEVIISKQYCESETLDVCSERRLRSEASQMLPAFFQLKY